MPTPIIGRSAHVEGEDIRTMARVVDLAQVMLDQGSAGTLTINIKKDDRVLYTTEITDAASTGILAVPTKPNEWDRTGYVNFIYTHSAASLAAGSPPFAFKGGNTYLIEYVFDTPDDGLVTLHHHVRILAR